MAQEEGVKLKAGALQRMTAFHSKKHMHEVQLFRFVIQILNTRGVIL